MRPLGEVVRASKSRQATTPPDTDDGMSTADLHEEMDMDEDMDDIPKPKRKKKEKKVAPIGKNGLPKRRIVKTRTTMDSKGFMGTFACARLSPDAHYRFFSGRRLLRVRVYGRGGIRDEEGP
jgi:hypothetical protein